MPASITRRPFGLAIACVLATLALPRPLAAQPIDPDALATLWLGLHQADDRPEDIGLIEIEVTSHENRRFAGTTTIDAGEELWTIGTLSAGNQPSAPRSAIVGRLNARGESDAGKLELHGNVLHLEAGGLLLDARHRLDLEEGPAQIGPTVLVERVVGPAPDWLGLEPFEVLTPIEKVGQNGIASMELEAHGKGSGIVTGHLTTEKGEVFEVVGSVAESPEVGGVELSVAGYEGAPASFTAHVPERSDGRWELVGVFQRFRPDGTSETWSTVLVKP